MRRFKNVLQKENRTLKMRSAQTPFGAWAIIMKKIYAVMNPLQYITFIPFGTVYRIPIKYVQTMNTL